MRLKVTRQIIENVRNGLFAGSGLPRFQVSWKLVADTEEARILKGYVEDRVVTRVWQVGRKTRPVPIRVSNLVEGFTYESEDVWAALEYDKLIRSMCGELARLVDDVRTFAKSEEVPIQMAEQSEDEVDDSSRIVPET